MSGTEIIFAVVILVALPLRIVLDLASFAAPKSNFDAAYAGLFLIAGVAMVFTADIRYWGYVAFGISAWYLFSYIRKRKIETKGGAKRENT